MSLIEQAISRARGLTGAAPEARKPARRLIRRNAIAAVSAAPPRAFAPGSLHAATMEHYGVVHDVADELAQRSYKILRTRILKRLEAQQWYSLAVTSAAPGDGKTLTAINLAMTLAQDPATSVFLVDMDLQRPSVAKYLGLKHGPGLSQYLAGEAAAEQVIYDVGIDRLSVVPNVQALHHSSELLISPRMAELIRFLEADSPRRVIVYDMPPALVGDDVMAFSDYVDGVLLVVSEGKTTRAALENARDVLSEMNLLGVVLNRSYQGKDAAYNYY